MTVHGSLASLPLSDALQWLSQGGKTGSLRLTTPEGKSTIVFDRGNIVGVELSLPDLLSDITQQGVADEDSIRSVLARMEPGSWSQSRILAALGLKDDEIDQAMANTSERAIISLLSSKEGSFVFEPASIEAAAEAGRKKSHRPLAVPMLLLNGARHIDEDRRAAATSPATPPPSSPDESFADLGAELSADELSSAQTPATSSSTPPIAFDPGDLDDFEILPSAGQESDDEGSASVQSAAADGDFEDFVESEVPADESERIAQVARIEDFRRPAVTPPEPSAPGTTSGSPQPAASAAPAEAPPESFSPGADSEVDDGSAAQGSPPPAFETSPESEPEILAVKEEAIDHPAEFLPPGRQVAAASSRPGPPANRAARTSMIVAAIAVTLVTAGVLLWQRGLLGGSEDVTPEALAEPSSTIAQADAMPDLAGEGDVGTSATDLAPPAPETEAVDPAVAEAEAAAAALEAQRAQAAELERRINTLVAARTADIEASLREEYTREIDKLRQELPAAQPDPEPVAAQTPASNPTAARPTARDGPSGHTDDPNRRAAGHDRGRPCRGTERSHHPRRQRSDEHPAPRRSGRFDSIDGPAGRGHCDRPRDPRTRSRSCGRRTGTPRPSPCRDRSSFPDRPPAAALHQPDAAGESRGHRHRQGSRRSDRRRDGGRGRRQEPGFRFRLHGSLDGTQQQLETRNQRRQADGDARRNEGGLPPLDRLCR